MWYLYSQDAVPNIERELPESKYLVLIRNPVEMAYSLHEQMTLHQAEHIFDFKKAWQMSPLRRQGRKTSFWISEPRLLDYQSVCLLGTQLERLFALVPRERILVLVLDDIKKDPRQEYLKTLHFLDVPDDQREDFSPRNPAKRVRFHTLQRLIVLGIKSERVLKSKLGLPPANSKLFPILNQWNKVPRPRPPLPAELESELQQFFEPEVYKLQKLLHRDFSNWLV